MTIQGNIEKVMPEKKPNWGSHVVFNPWGCNLNNKSLSAKTFFFLWFTSTHWKNSITKKYVIACHSSEWSAWCRNDESGIQQLSFEGKMFHHQNFRAERKSLTSLKTLMFSKRKGDILWQVTNHYWRCVGRSLGMSHAHAACAGCHALFIVFIKHLFINLDGRQFQVIWEVYWTLYCLRVTKIVASDSSSESQLASTMNHTVNSLI